MIAFNLMKINMNQIQNVNKDKVLQLIINVWKMIFVILIFKVQLDFVIILVINFELIKLVVLLIHNVNGVVKIQQYHLILY